MELETAVYLKCDFVHLVCIDGYYDMVKFQEVAKIWPLASGVDFIKSFITQIRKSKSPGRIMDGSTPEAEAWQNRKGQQGTAPA